MTPNPMLDVRGVCKDFGVNRVLDHVDLTLFSGEIHALLGENGAGKTTLMNIVRGLVSATEGEILISGQSVRPRNPQDSTAAGIGMVHQHFLLVPVFTVAENLVLSAQNDGIFLRRAAIIDKASRIADELGWKLRFDARVADLPVGVQQRVEILKVLLSDARILLFDEPTAVLAPDEVDELLSVLRSMRASGHGIVFVSHKLNEVMAVCDRVTVVRRGKVISTTLISDTNPQDLAHRMVGGEASAVLTERAVTEAADSSVKNAQAALTLSGLSTSRRTKEETALSDLSFSIAGGEILGIAGVDGNGQSELFEVLTGLRPFSASSFTINGVSIERLSPARLHRYGITAIPPDRQREGLALSLSVRDNLVMVASRLPEFRRFGLMRTGSLTQLAQSLADRFDIRTASISQPASSLSGGNQQKIVIARALWRTPKLLIAASPTRGLDIAATAYVHNKIRACQAAGAAVVLISTELDEVLDLSTRVAVLYEGRIAGIVPPDTPRKTIGLLMGGRITKAAA